MDFSIFLRLLIFQSLRFFYCIYNIFLAIQSITVCPFTRPNCLFPIFIVETFKDGISIIPDEEFPIKPSEYFTSDKYSTGLKK